MHRLGKPRAKTALLLIVTVVVAGGFVLALFSNMLSLAPSGYTPASASPNYMGSTNIVLGTALSPLSYGAGGASVYGNTQVVRGGTTYTESSTTTVTSTTSPRYQSQSASSNSTQGSPPGQGGSIEFSSQLTLTSPSPQQAASSIAALAYSVGGYVAYQAAYPDTANVVIRIPASQYSQVLSQVEGLGTLDSLTSNSNDVSVQYTDLNATLASLQTEQQALLRLLNQSSSINSTLAIEGQLQGVNRQINDAESQILQTRTLISYSTINVTINERAQQTRLSLALSATPSNGTAPLSVTFNAVVKGGTPQYVVNYNFGDGFAAQGQIVIHTYTRQGSYRVTVSVTDQNGTVAQGGTTIHVTAPAAGAGVGRFLGTVGGLFVSVVEGIVEVAVVVLPLAAVGAAVIIPIQRRGKSTKGVSRSQSQ